MSAPLPLDALSLSRSSRQLLQRAGFHSRQAVAALRPTQLAHGQQRRRRGEKRHHATHAQMCAPPLTRLCLVRAWPELGCTPALALSILREIDAAPARQKDEDDTDAGTAGEEKTTSSNDVKAPQQRLPIVHAAKVEPHQCQASSSTTRKHAEATQRPTFSCLTRSLLVRSLPLQSARMLSISSVVAPA